MESKEFADELSKHRRWKLKEDLPNLKHCDFMVPVLIFNDEVVKIVLNSILVFFFSTTERCRDISFCVNVILIYLQFQNGSVGEQPSSLTPLKSFLPLQKKGHTCQKILLWFFWHTLRDIQPQVREDRVVIKRDNEEKKFIVELFFRF